MSEEIVIHVEAEPVEVIEPVEPIVIVASETPPEVLLELAELRAYRATQEEQRLADIEADAAAALAIAELIASEPEVISEPVIVEEEPLEDTPPQADSEPDNSHAWFKEW